MNIYSRKCYFAASALPRPSTVIAISVWISLQSAHAFAQAGVNSSPLGAPSAPAANIAPPPSAGLTPGMPPAGSSAGTSGAPASTGPSLSLNDLVRTALGVNTGLTAAQQRLDKAQELINQVNAQGRPQIRLDADDTYSTFPTGAPSLPSLSIQNPVLPGGSQIPTVIDVGGNFPSGFLGFGGNGIAGGFGLTPGEAAPTANSPASPSSPVPTQQNGPAPSTPSSSVPSSNGNLMQRSEATPSPRPGKHAPSLTNVAEAVAVPAIAGYFATDGSGSKAAEQPAVADASDREESAPEPDASQVGNAVTGSTPAATSDHMNGYAARVSLIQFLDVFGVLPTARSAERDVRDFYALDVDRLENETALAAKNLFFNALFAQAQVDTLQEQVQYAKTNVDMTTSRFNHGFVSRLDVLNAQTALATAQQALTAGQNQLNLAQANLRYLLGTNITGTYTLVPPPLPPLDTTIDVPTAIDTALANRPEVLQARKNIDEASGLVKLAGDALKPAIGLVVTGENISTDSNTQPDSYGSVGALMYFPLDDGGFTRSRVRSAKTDLAAQKLALEQLKLTIGLEVQQASLNIQNAQAQVASAQTAVVSANEAVRIADERYKAGLGTFLDNLNALAQLARAETNLSVAQFLYQTSLAQFVRTIGGR